MSWHLTPGEQRTRASAAAAVARALAHTRPAESGQDALGDLYPYVTPARARQIRHEIEETRNARR